MPNSIGDLASLSRLDLRECKKLAQLPDSIKCKKLTQLPDSIGSFVHLSQLSMSGCHSLRQIPDSIGKWTSLNELCLKSTAIEELPGSIGSLKKLKTLDASYYASYCASLACMPNSIGDLKSLSRLGLRECKKLAQLPDFITRMPNSIGDLVSISRLYLRECKKLVQLPDSISCLVCRSQLSLSGCHSLRIISNSIGKCHSLRQSPDSIGKLKSLTELRLKSMAIEELPESIGSLKKLETLNASYFHRLPHVSIAAAFYLLFFSFNTVLLKCPKTPPTNNSAMDYQMADSKHFLRRSRPFGISYESSYSSNDLTRNVVITLSQGSLVKSMDFHPVQQILLLVGTNMGDVMVWEVDSGARIVVRKFKVWDLGTCSVALQASLANDYTTSVNRVMWSPDGILFGVAYSKHMVHIYSHHGDAVTGAKQQTFKGHEAPVYSIFPHNRENIQFIFSTSTDGKIKAWFYDNMGSRVDYVAPGHSFTKMAYNTNGTRLFLCGTNKEGESYLFEWNESEEAVKRTYHGLGKRSGGFVQFDIAKNLFLAAGDESMVKFWDMDNNNILTSTDADNGSLASPCIRFNKEGILLAISTGDNSIKILANANGIRLLRTMDNWPFDASRITPGPIMKDSESMADVKPGIADDSGDKSRNWKPTEINEPSQCRSIRLPDNSMATRVPRLSYTNSGCAILALSSNVVHKLWKWEESDQNLTGRATTSAVPQLWQPPGGDFMTNDTSANPEDAVPCFALSNNDSWLMSASGGEISWFHMMTFERIRQFTPPPPPNNDIIEIGMEDSAIQIHSGRVDEKNLKGHQRIIKGFAFSNSLNVLVSSGAGSQMMMTFLPHPSSATFLAFDPRADLTIAIGMEDCSIQICCFPFYECKANLKGHQKRITSLAFSNVLNVLVSSGADSQLCVWSTDGWEKQASKFLQMPTGQGAAPFADTRVQFHVDQIHLLVVHETQIATCKAPELECLKQWDTREASAPITDATYSCNGQSLYVSFEDGSISVLSAYTLRLRCRINPAAYIPPNPNLRVYPLVIAAHPSQPNQFALGLTDGSVYVLEPLESEGEWGGSPPVENGAEPSTTSGATNSDQPQR
ncbi:hypothetical protein ACJRO7_014343 [Eucalyptus globulus]|uniref:Disease resistance R13L4/SHOC-2-like LRR domain-containing protein n=1 Tax=Eucalyptus globulus TaxID=34317 RepID=A0ABD3L0T3_EUCGL